MKSKEIKQILKDIFPHLEVPWFRDEEYDLPSRIDVVFFLRTDPINEMKFLERDFDCDDFALQLHAAVKREHHWAFGEAFGDRIKGKNILHNLNVFIGDDETVCLVEPQTDEIWEAVKGDDNIRIVGM